MGIVHPVGLEFRERNPTPGLCPEFGDEGAALLGRGAIKIWPVLTLPPEVRPRVAALVDLPRTPQAGGHVKYWERIAQAAAEAADFPFDLTVYLSGDAPEEALSPYVRHRHLKPIFSTARLKFLPYVPDHTDLAPYHPTLARALNDADLIHTTDGFFAFAKTAERVSRAKGKPLTTSFHTDTPNYARIFTRQTIETIFARWPAIGRALVETWRAPERQGAKMERRLEQHLHAVTRAFATRETDRRLAGKVLGPERVGALRIGVDKALFDPRKRDVAALRRDYSIAGDRVVALFVGRVDVGKNVPILMEAAARAIAAGAPLHLIVAGVGPLRDILAERLAGHVGLPGFVPPAELARLYASVDVVVLPSEVEIGGMAPGEAMAAGSPLLVARGGGSADVYGETPAIQIVESGVDAWSAALAEITKDARRREAMRQAAVDYSAQRLASWSDVVREDLVPGWLAALASAGARERR
jgi:glycosyltransferase involved in cell wall biosynthesis